jgi:anti-sigma regulatory factor (Ser/Thr protein kinase)
MPGTVGRVPAPSAMLSGLPWTRAGEFPPVPWPETPLGPSERWDPVLRAIVDLILASPVAMALAYGDDLTLIYNEGYAELLGAKHPSSFGRPAAEVFCDEWHHPNVGELIERVYRTGEPVLVPESLLPIARDSPDGPGQAIVTRGYSPVRDSGGRIIGLLTVATESDPPPVIRRLQGLGELAAALSGTLTLDDVARVTLRTLLMTFDADQVTVGVDDADGWRLVRWLRGELLDEADERLPPLWRRQPGDWPAPMVTAARTGEAVFIAEGQPLRTTALDRHDQKIRSLAALPLRTASLHGALTLGYQRTRLWPPAERALLIAAAELIAQAAERARRYENQHGIAQLLQRSLLPENLPDLPYLRLAARYDVGLDGNAAGGDFYDAFQLPDGQLGVVLGDVAGHDVAAAARMGQVRAALRAVALGEPDPARVLTALDRLVASLGAEARSDELFVTVVYGVIDQPGQRLTLAGAGHPAPLIRRVSPGARPDAHYLPLPPGAPLGLGGERCATTVDFLPGDTLLLFSDGVIERRGQSLTVGFERLARAVAGAATDDPRTLCALAARAVPGNGEDDVAVLAVEYAVRPSRSASIVVPAEASAPGRVRRWLTAQLTTWQVPESVIGVATLCASELTTNALLHAGTSARVEVDLSAERLLVSVADRGTRGTVTPTRTDVLSSRGRGLGLIEQLSDAWGTDPTVRGSTVWFEILMPGRTPLL